MRRKQLVRVFRHVTVPLLIGIVSVVVVAAENPLNAQLQRLKELREADLITEQIYSSEVRRVLKQLDVSKQPQEEKRTVDAQKLNAKIEWGEFDQYFTVSNLRTGTYAPEGSPEESLATHAMLTPVAALYFDVCCRKNFFNGYSFEADFYNAEKTAVIATLPIHLNFERINATRLRKDDRGTACIPLNGNELDLSTTSRVVFKVTDLFAFSLPQIDMTVFSELFDVANLHTGPFILKNDMFYSELIHAVFFDVKATVSMTMGSASFKALLFDEEDSYIGTVPQVLFEYKFTTENAGHHKWPRGGEATAIIPYSYPVNIVNGKEMVSVEGRKVARIVLRQN